MRKPLAFLVPAFLLVTLGAVLVAPDPAPSVQAAGSPPQAVNLATPAAEPGPEPSAAPDTPSESSEAAESPSATESGEQIPPTENPVLALQIRLLAAGFDPGPLDGQDGPRTRAAERRSLGIVDPPPEPRYIAVAQWPTSLEPCGGDLPPCWVKNRESHGDYSAVNPTGCGGWSCGGAWQFHKLTWAWFGGYEYAQDAPPAVQDEKARLTWNGGRGCAAWSAC